MDLLRSSKLFELLDGIAGKMADLQIIRDSKVEVNATGPESWYYQSRAIKENVTL